MTLQFDNVEPLEANHQLVIAEAAVRSNTFVENNQETGHMTVQVGTISFILQKV